MPKRPGYDPQPKISPTVNFPLRVHLRHPPANAAIHPHRHNWGQIVCPQSGTIRVHSKNTAWVVPTFRAVWIPPGTMHAVSVIGHVEFFALYIHHTASPMPRHRCAVVEVSDLMRALMASLARETSSAKSSTLKSKLLLEEFRSASHLPMGLPFPADPRLLALCEAIMDEPAEAKTLREWGPVVGASERTLARLFRTELGTSFGAWRRQARLARAAGLLAQGFRYPRLHLRSDMRADQPFQLCSSKRLGSRLHGFWSGPFCSAIRPTASSAQFRP